MTPAVWAGRVTTLLHARPTLVSAARDRDRGGDVRAVGLLKLNTLPFIVVMADSAVLNRPDPCHRPRGHPMSRPAADDVTSSAELLA